MDTLPEISLDFDEEKHIYSHRGIKLQSVTQIMEPMSLIAYKDVPRSTLENAADRGTRVHEQVSADVIYGVLETDEDTEPYIAAWKSFKDSFTFEWLASEYRVFHKDMNYAGTIDLIAKAGDDSVDIIDIKTTAQFHGVLLSVQLAAYAEALKSQGVKVRDLYGLQLLNNGKYHFEKIKGDYNLFIHSLAIMNAMAQDGR